MPAARRGRNPASGDSDIDPPPIGERCSAKAALGLPAAAYFAWAP